MTINYSYIYIYKYIYILIYGVYIYTYIYIYIYIHILYMKPLGVSTMAPALASGEAPGAAGALGALELTTGKLRSKPCKL